MDNNNLLSRAVGLHQSGDLQQALVLYEECCGVQPENPDVWRLRGGALSQLGRENEACGFFGRSVEAAASLTAGIDVNFYRLDFANSLSRLGELVEAAREYGVILQNEPENKGACFGMGRIKEQWQDFPAAIDFYRAACVGNADDVPVLLGLGGCCWKMLRREEADKAFRAVLEYDENSAQAWLGLGLCEQNEDSQKAKAYIARALEIAPEFAQALDAMAFMLLKEGKVAQALELSGRALDNEKRDADIICTAAMVQRELGEAETACKLLYGASALVGNNPKYFDSLLLSLQYVGGLAPEELCKMHRQWAERFEPKLTGDKLCRPLSHPEDSRLRVGFVSADFCSHPVSFFLEPLLPHLMGDDCTVYLYSNTAGEDATTERLKKCGAVWRDIRGVPDHDAAGMIAADGIDALIDLSGHTPGNRLGIFPYKPGRKQFTWLGYPDTTGMDCIDYRIVDELSDPEGTESLCSERLLRLPGGFLCYQFPDGYTPPAPRSRRDTDPFVFGCFNNLAKLSSECLTTWAKILLQCPKGVLLLKGAGLDDPLTRHFWEDKLARHGINPSRLILRGKTAGLQQHLDTYAEVDIALDTFPYNGTTTTYEALSCGVPVVTLCGARHASKVGSSIMAHLGRENFITDTADKYISLALMFTHDPDKLYEIKKLIQKDMIDINLSEDKYTLFSLNFKSCILSVL